MASLTLMLHLKVLTSIAVNSVRQEIVMTETENKKTLLFEFIASRVTDMDNVIVSVCCMSTADNRYCL